MLQSRVIERVRLRAAAFHDVDIFDSFQPRFFRFGIKPPGCDDWTAAIRERTGWVLLAGSRHR
jgi:hypothetical protein